MHKLTIEPTANHGTRILLDDFELQNVTEYNLFQGVREPAVLQVTVVVEQAKFRKEHTPHEA